MGTWKCVLGCATGALTLPGNSPSKIPLSEGMGSGNAYSGVAPRPLKGLSRLPMGYQMDAIYFCKPRPAVSLHTDCTVQYRAVLVAIEMTTVHYLLFCISHGVPDGCYLVQYCKPFPAISLHTDCTVLYCTVLYCTVLYCCTLCMGVPLPSWNTFCYPPNRSEVVVARVVFGTEGGNVLLYCTVLCSTVLYCTVLYCLYLPCSSQISRRGGTCRARSRR